MKKLILLLIIALSFLFSPAPRENTKEVCGRYVHITSFAGFTLNPDTYGFLFPAINPDSLVADKAQRQSRPLFILLGSATGYSIYYISYPFHTYLNSIYKKYWTGAYPESVLFMLGNFYVSFVILNIIILWLSLYVFQKIFILLSGNQGANRFVMYCLMVFIASSQVTKAFFWTPHQQMFTLFTPLLCIYIVLRCNRKDSLLSFSRLSLLAFASGLLLLVYGNFILLLPVLLYCFSRNYLLYHDRQNRLILVSKNVALLLLFALPMLAWMYMLTLYNTTYYNFEIDQYRQLIWMKDTLSISFGLFWKTFSGFTISYFKTMGEPLIILLFSLFALLVARAKPVKKDINVLSVGFVFLVFFLFYWILGFYQQRLSYTFVPIIICLLAAVCRNAWHQKKLAYMVGSAALCWHLYNVLSYGPFC